MRDSISLSTIFFFKRNSSYHTISITYGAWFHGTHNDIYFAICVGFRPFFFMEIVNRINLVRIRNFKAWGVRGLLERSLKGKYVRKLTWLWIVINRFEKTEKKISFYFIIISTRVQSTHTYMPIHEHKSIFNLLCRLEISSLQDILTFQQTFVFNFLTDFTSKKLLLYW
jgi:hypothetical protein